MTETWLEWIHAGGTWLAFVATFFEGELFPVLSKLPGLAKGWGPWVLLAVAFAGSFGEGQLYFALGRTSGERWFRRHPEWRVQAERAKLLLETHGATFIVGFRFLYGLRAVSPFAMGAAHLGARHFLVFNLLGALLWTAVLLGAGAALSPFLQ